MRVKLDDVCERGSSNLKQSDVIGKTGDYPVYGAAGYIGNVDFYHQSKPYVAVVKDGAGIGRATLLPAKSSVIGTMQYLIPKDNVFPEYLSYVVQYMHLEKYFLGATIPHIYFRDYKSEEFNLAPIENQREIVDILEKVQAIISDRQQELQKLDELVKARFVEMFGDPIINEKEWQTEKLSTLCKAIYGGGTPSKSHPEYFEGNIPWVSPKDMKSMVIKDSVDHITSEAVKNSSAKMVPAGAVLMVIRSGILKHTLPVAIASVDLTVNQDMKAFIVGERIKAEFLMYYFKAIEKDVLGGVRGVTADNIDFKEFQNKMVIVPPIKEQNLFSSFINQINKSKLLHIKHLTKHNYRKDV